MSTHKHQLEVGTYCEFDTPDELKAAFFKARNLGIKTIGGTYGRKHMMVGISSGKLICGKPRNENKYREIPTAEFLARMEGTWEKPELNWNDAVALIAEKQNANIAQLSVETIESKLAEWEEDYTEETDDEAKIYLNGKLDGGHQIAAIANKEIAALKARVAELENGINSAIDSMADHMTSCLSTGENHEGEADFAHGMERAIEILKEKTQL